MKKLFIFRMAVVLTTAMTLSLTCMAQVSNNGSDGSYLGAIPVYRFTMDSLYYNGTKRLSAVGSEYTADLYSSIIGENTYFKIYIDGNYYAVLSNPYGHRVSSEYYYAAWIKKGGQYVKIPTLAYKAGAYFLALPFAKTDDRRNANTTASVSSNSTSTSSTTKQVDWQLMGKVRVVSGMRTTRSHGEFMMRKQPSCTLPLMGRRQNIKSLFRNTVLSMTYMKTAVITAQKFTGTVMAGTFGICQA